MMTVEDMNKMKGKNSVAFTAFFILRTELNNANAKMLMSLSVSPLHAAPQFQYFNKVAELKKALQLRGLSIDGLKAELQQ
jgi:hypothetical protein